MKPNNFTGIENALSKGGILSVFKGGNNLRVGQIQKFSGPKKLNYDSEAIIYGYNTTDMLSTLSQGYLSKTSAFLNITDRNKGLEGIEELALNGSSIENIFDKWVFNNQTYVAFKTGSIYKVQFHKNSVPVSEAAGNSFSDMYYSIIRKEYPQELYDHLDSLLKE